MAACGANGNRFGTELQDIPARRPERKSISGNFIVLEPLRAEHADDLYEVVGGTEEERASLWDYMLYGPFTARQSFQSYIAKCHWLLCPDATCPFLEAIAENNWGHRMCVPSGRLVFDDLGYRRFEWKCNTLAAQRLGFIFEGIFRQHMITKGRNRDTAWFSIIDSDWPIVKQAFQAWLDSKNFDEQGRQRQALASLRK
ncbi:hypothetical protein V1525DRAFT_452431 [Lipomyces kononenkoae]|uniref:Uncharacterized protein n=1 Tax=Lipomyces kononenkoae TaxID=34357 RepID=A0ACC3ST77_LIPKO